MVNRRIIAAALVAGFFTVSLTFGQTLEENWNDFLHYTKIGRLDLAKGYAQAIIGSNPDPVKLLTLAQDNPQGYAFLLRVIDTASDSELVQLSEKVLALIEQGRYVRRSDPKVILEEVNRLSGDTARARHTAVKRLQNAGEYAIPFMLDALADRSRSDEFPNIVWALPQVGRDAIRPLAAGLQTEDVAIKAEIIRALGGIGYPQSLGYLKYAVEKEDSTELRELSKQSIAKINPAALKIAASSLFYRLAENYYYHAESLAPAEDADFANIWFWDKDGKRLVREKVDKRYFYELMSMRACEWSLKADPGFGWSIGLWLAAYFKAESRGLTMPSYFGTGHADAGTYATTAGPEYLHQALARGVRDKDAYVALSAVEALATTAGEKSLLYQIGEVQPLIQALTFKDKAVRYSAAIAIAAGGPRQMFPERHAVVQNLAQALRETPEQASEDANSWSVELANSYALRSAKVMFKLAQTRNPIIELSGAQGALIEATKDNRPEIQVLSGQVLAYLNSPEAQRAVAGMGLSEDNPMGVRIAAFNSLAVSGKLNANLLDSDTIDALYSLVSSQQIDAQLRAAAAGAYGSLNLPSQKVKDLILDQARS